MTTQATLTPTPEQEAVLDAYLTGNRLVVDALAGSGKTSTLRMLAYATPRRGALYVAYNKAIATDAAASFPGNTLCRTAHSLAYAAVGYRLADKLRRPRQRAADVARILGITGRLILENQDEAPVVIERAAQSRAVLDTVGRFSHSADYALSPRHVKRVPALDEEAQSEFDEVILGYARDAWGDLCDPAGKLRLDHDHYLKLWHLTSPAIPSDVIYLDEAQDCQPAGTVVLTPSGPVKIEDLKTGDLVISYTGQSQRLRRRGSPISSISSRLHDGELVAVRTQTGQLSSRYTPGHICLAKIGPAFEGKTMLYLMRRGQSWRVGVTSSHHGSIGTGHPSSGLAGRLREEDGDEIWVLRAFDDKRDALMAEAMIAAKYGIPETRFRDNGQRSIGQDRLDAFWEELGNLTESGNRLLAEHGRDIRYPLARRSFTESGARSNYLLYSRPATIRACNLMDGMLVLDADWTISEDTSGGRLWRAISVGRDQYTGDVWSMSVAGDHTYVGDGIVTHNCNPVIADIVTKQDHAQLILVGDRHQQLYGWRGARDAMTSFDGVRLALTKSFRFGPAIAEVANEWLAQLRSNLRVVGHDPIPSTVGRIAYDDVAAILCRTNAGCIGQAIAAESRGRKAAITGGTSELAALARAAGELQDRGETSHPEFMGFRSWPDVVEYAATDGAAENLATFVRLVNDYGSDELLRIINSLSTDEDDADLVISTGHRAKGREWAAVLIGADFKPYPRKDPETGELIEPRMSDEARMLAYVAVTRAKLRLDPSGLDWAIPSARPLGAGV